MSLAVFPSWIGEGPSGTNRWGPKLPIKKTPSFKTLTQTPANNVGELRISLTQYAVWMFELNLAWMRGDFSPAQINSAVQQIVGFYGQMQGSASDWLYFDPEDNGSNFNVVNSGAGIGDLYYNSIGIGDSSTANFTLTRTVGGMRDLVQNFVSGYPMVYVGGVLQSPTAYSINSAGVLTFNVAPSFGSVVAWYGQFYFRCRFLEDSWQDLEAFRYQLYSSASVKFKSLLR
jgi:hypothetical protein